MTPRLDIRGLCTLLQVYDMPRSVQFYCDLLGFEIGSRSATYAIEDGIELFHWALLHRPGGIALMLNTAYDEGERPEEPDDTRHSGHDDVRLYLACTDVDAAYQRVKAFGVQCALPATAPYGMRQLNFHDPDGYGITLQWSAGQEEQPRTA